MVVIKKGLEISVLSKIAACIFLQRISEVDGPMLILLETQLLCQVVLCVASTSELVT